MPGIEIGGVTVKAGERRSIELQVGQLYTHTALHIPVEVICGKRAGPVLLVCAAIHGDEINGVEIIRRLLKTKLSRQIKGTLIAVPIVNVLGFVQRSRYLPDRRDLNRCFPGSEKGSLGARIANLFRTQIVDKATHIIDLHTAAIHRSNLPQIRTNMDHPVSALMAEAFGAPVIINSTLREGSLRGNADENGLPVLTYEAGEALRFDEIAIAGGVRGIVGVMRALNMLGQPRSVKEPASKPISRPVKDKAAPVVAKSSYWVRAEQDGILRPMVPLGARVEKDTILGVISAPLGEQELLVRAPTRGIVIGRVTLPLVNEGEAMFHIARFETVSGAERQVEAFHNAVMEDDELNPDPAPLV
ncbi:MAG: succinylglutamate desuccinylase/aspartoacylase family protein [Hahellaceae bacterium]|nr:succinylglutamate desuccinylase/aspartoacylase family protein [Hahellaceae bacterium]MCP5170395.1 succinylglutamate desuccinylase/aspartoacylase family protein [Hahellaceae bacterium]